MKDADIPAIRGIRFPGRYIQAVGAIHRLGEEAKSFGRRAIVVVDHGIIELVEQDLTNSLGGLVEAIIVRHSGECTESEIARLVIAADEARADVVIGVGGGKALDTAKVAACDIGKPIIVFPTIAASDAPCSALAVVYDDSGAVAYDRFLPRNPDLVLVDLQLIANAPTRFLSAGIGDALATWYEAESCRRSGAVNCMKLEGASLAYQIARYCRETIFQFGVAAIAECDAGKVGPAMERVVEANILLSGIGFESGGVAAAHAIHHGLCELDDVHHYLHGEKVAIGVLASLKMYGDEAEFELARSFCEAVRLPVKLGDIGIKIASDEKPYTVARRACRVGEIIHNEPISVTETMVASALRQLA